MQRVLIVDDEEDIRLLIRILLEKEGYGVDEAKDGKDGLAKMKKTPYDLAILDFFMPEMSGREVLEKMRDDPNLKGIKSVFLTAANFSAAGEDELKKLGSLDYIKKPFDNDNFLKRIKKVLDM